MFKCRVCSGTPFAAFFGLSDSDNSENIDDKVLSDVEDVSSVPNAEELPNQESELIDGPRNAEEIGYLVKTWDTYVHERVKHLWKNAQTRIDVLKNIAEGCSKNDDPILGNDISCVKWIGKYEDGFPVIYLKKPGEDKEDSTYVNRMLVFMFADQESYEKVDANKYISLPMGCGNQWCVSLTHIVIN